MRIQIEARQVRACAVLADTPTARAVWAALPLEGCANVWGDEIYFAIPVDCGEEPDARQDVAVGDLAFWPPGQAFCVFFGPTPVSRGSAPRAYSPVNVFGRVEGDARVFSAVRDGAPVRVSRASEECLPCP